MGSFSSKTGKLKKTSAVEANPTRKKRKNIAEANS
jgi:hypothetical protein